MASVLQTLNGDWLRLLLTIELLGLAATPLAALLFGALPDRGYGLSKPLGMLLVAVANWWLGSTIGAANFPWLLWLLCIALTGVSTWLLMRGLVQLPVRDLGWRRTVAAEEALFLLAFVGWAFVRALKPEIFTSEKPMDFMLLQTSGSTHSFPPPDLWYQGARVNYYYLGYAIFGMLGRMAGVDVRFGFDLYNVAIFALSCTAACALGAALTRRLLGGLGGTFFLMLAGDLQAVGQFWSQIQGGGLRLTGLDLWCSTRVIDGGCLGQHTITEFPAFSLLFADLHPHVMAIPFVLLVIGCAVHALLDPGAAAAPRAVRWTRLGIAALAAGSLFAINSWDYPTYLVVVLAAQFLAWWRRGDGSRTWPRLLEIAAIVPLSVLFYFPYLLTVHATTVFSMRYSVTSLGEMAAVLGGLLLPLLVFVAAQAGPRLWSPGRPAQESARRRDAEHLLTPRQVCCILCAFALGVALVCLPCRTDILFLTLAAGAACALLRPRGTDDGAVSAALLLVLVSMVVLSAADVVFLRDVFSAGPQYRLNTVFKLYYQGWILLATAVPVGIVSVARMLRARSRSLLLAVWCGLAAVLCTVLGAYSVEGVASQGNNLAPTSGLDGLAFVQHVEPDVYAAVQWVQTHTAPGDVIAEGEGMSYWNLDPDPSTWTSQISALSARPTIVGWPNDHEWLWRGGFASQAAGAKVLQRMNDADTLYTTTDPGTMIAILSRYDVRRVYVGPYERATYYAYGDTSGYMKFGRFLTPVFTRGAVSIFAVPDRLPDYVPSVPPVTSVLPVLQASSLRVDSSRTAGAPAGQSYLVLQLQVRNATAKPLSFTLDDLFLLDPSTKQHYAVALDPDVAASQLEPGTVAPHAVVSGDVAFAVDDSALRAQSFSVVFKYVPQRAGPPVAPVLPAMIASDLRVDARSRASGLAPGQVYLLVHVLLRNKTQKTLQFTPANIVLLDPETGTKYAAGLDPTIRATALQAGSIPPSGQAEGDVAFPLPAAASHSPAYSIVFQRS